MNTHSYAQVARVGALSLGLFFMNESYATETTEEKKALVPQIELVSIDPVKVSTSHANFYMTVTSYHSYLKPKHERIPPHPTHWPHKMLDKVKDVVMWKAPLADNQSVTLNIALLERNVAPWFTDDLVGTVSVHLKNENGKLIAQWSVPSSMNNKVEQDKNSEHIFTLTSDEGSVYRVTFTVK